MAHRSAFSVFLLICVLTLATNYSNGETQDPQKTDLKFKNISNADVTIQWTCHNKPYNVSLEVKDSDFCYNHCKPGPRTVQTENCELHLEKLCPNTQYEVLIKGKQQEKPYLGVFRTLSNPPSNPRNLTIKTVTSSSFTLSWNIPECPNNTAFTYKVQYGAASSKADVVIPAKDEFDFQATISGLEAEKKYDVALLTCVDKEEKICSKSPVIPVTTRREKPGPPRYVRTRRLSAEAIHVSWLKPNFFKAYNFSVKCSESAEGGSYVPVGKKEEYNCEGLKPYTTYYATVIATFTDSEGEMEGEPSKIASERTGPAAPSKPVLTSVTPISSAAISVAWKKPSAPNGPLNGYQILYNDGKLNKSVDVGASELLYTISKLNPYTEYTISVKAYNFVGIHRAYGEGDQKTIKTLMDKPSVPTALRINETSETDVTIEWDLPAKPSGPLDGYLVTYMVSETVEGDPPKPRTTVEVQKLSLTVSNLMPYRKYSFAVKAFNAGDKKYYSDEAVIYAQTEAAAPNEPLNVKLYAESSSKLLVTWNKPVPKTGPTTYVVELSEVDAKENKCNMDVKDKKVYKSEKLEGWKVVIWDLKKWEPKKCYQARVIASTPKGETTSKVSNILQTNETSLVPCQPKNVVAVAQSPHEILVTWKAPEHPKNTTYEYYVKCAKSEKSEEQYAKVDKQGTLKYTCQKLKSYESYYAFVKAAVKDEKTGEEVFGAPAHSEPTMTMATNPGKPKIIQIEAKTPYSLDVFWDSPDEPNGPIDYYNISVFRDDKRFDIAPVENTQRYQHIENLTAYTDYKIVIAAYNLIGKNLLRGDADSKSHLTLADNPSEPLNFKVTQERSENIKLEWSEPKEKHGLLNGYILKYIVNDIHKGDQEHPVLNETVIYKPAKLSFELQDLIPWRTYNISLLAFNEESHFPRFESKAVSLQAKTKVGAPHVTSVQVKLPENGSIEVLWTSPVPFTGPTNYSVDFLSANCNDRKCDDESKVKWETKTFTDGLDDWAVESVEAGIWENGYCYKALLYARTVGGESLSWSDVECSARNSSKVPSPPRDVKLVSSTASSITVTWKEPENPNSFSGYEVSCTSNKEKPIFVDANDSVGRKHTCGSLQTFTKYFVTIRAFISVPPNKRLPGEDSDTIEITTQPGVPGAVVFEDVSNITSNSAIIKWQIPAVKNGLINYYEVSISGDNTVVNINLTEPEYEAQNLISNVEYEVEVNAVNVDDKNNTLIGNMSNITFKTLVGAPGKVENLKANAKMTSVELTWEVPKDYRGNISHYDIYLVGSVSQSKNSTKPSVSFDNLLPSKSYTAKVVAVAMNDEDSLEGEPALIHFNTPSGIPPQPKVALQLSNETFTSMDFFVPNNLFNETNGTIIEYVLIVGSKAVLPNASSGDYSKDNITTKYQDVKDKNPIPVYRSSPPNWLPKNVVKDDPLNCKDGKDGKTCTLGAQSDCSKAIYCNGPLRSKTEYGVKIRAYTKDGWSETPVAYGTTNGSAFHQLSAFLAVLMTYLAYKNY